MPHPPRTGQIWRLEAGSNIGIVSRREHAFLVTSIAIQTDGSQIDLWRRCHWSLWPPAAKHEKLLGRLKRSACRTSLLVFIPQHLTRVQHLYLIRLLGVSRSKPPPIPPQRGPAQRTLIPQSTDKPQVSLLTIHFACPPNTLLRTATLLISNAIHGVVCASARINWSSYLSRHVQHQYSSWPNTAFAMSSSPRSSFDSNPVLFVVVASTQSLLRGQ